MIISKRHSIGMLIIRIGIGLGFLFFHGWGKLVGGPERWASLGEAMNHIGITFGYTFWGFMAALTESLGGLLFALGLFHKPLSLLLAFTMFIASLQHLIPGKGSAASALKFLFFFSGIYFLDPGKYSIDYLLRKKKDQ